MATGPRRGTSRRRFLTTLGGIALAGSAGCVARGEPTDLEGQIVMDGSNTVFPHGAAVAEEFMWRNANVQIPASGSGTGAGFQRFCAGETVLQNASRAILPDEEAACEGNDVEWIELGALLDGLAVMKHPDNDWCDCLSVEELRQIWQSGSDVQTWADVRDGWPDEEIELYGRDSASGTFDYFTNVINGEYGNIRNDYSGTPDTNVIVRGVRGDEHAMGFGGAGYYYENEDDIDLIAVENRNGECVLPTRETIEDGSYWPLSRPMYLYVRRDALEREEVAEFMTFYFREVDETGYELGRDLDIVEEGETLTWTQWAARRVGFYAIPDEHEDPEEPSVERGREKIEDVIGGVDW